jgi:hypothetical protein
MDDYGTPPNLAELETSRLISMGVPAEAAYPLGRETAHLMRTGMSERDARIFAPVNVRKGVHINRFKARIEYAKAPEKAIRPVDNIEELVEASIQRFFRESRNGWVGD